ncbi:hypothetical protein DFO77_10599 [Marinilabilia salmonicolor]|jgi:hypothetical protein|uniref:Uncharacterized protein n=1 Tax=Marinilabilia salmonicolor TaxID=989 RepID=A0A368VF10_9BACT|nr:hypothetical protein DFO77_10599 [Marinilabilia salmonicolor]
MNFGSHGGSYLYARVFGFSVYAAKYAGLSNL